MRPPFQIPSDNEPEGPREPSFRMSTNQLGVIIAFVSIGILFAATLIAYVITRLQAETWRPEQAPGLPPGLLASTALLAGVSGAMHWAWLSVRRNHFRSLEHALRLAFLFGVAFLFGQLFNWREMLLLEVSTRPQSLYVFTFYLLTGVHAAHVIGGFVPLGIVAYRASQREYSSSRCDGVKFCTQYWHLLGLIWIVLLTTLYVTR